MDKNKIIEAAAKLIAKGAYDKAIKEYQRVLDADPKDIRILQKMGELYLKKNDSAQAVESFIRVAESYSADGFFLKAVAMYKQVLKINPDLVEVNSKLAELHQQLGLMSEAMAYFQLVANAQDKAGNTKASLDTLKKMVDLDPDNVASRTKLAELYAREKMNPQALAEFNRAADYLKKVNRGDDYLRVAERISALDPDNVALARELAQAYLQRSDQKRALAKLQVCFKADPRDVETLTLLGQAFLGLGQTSKTVSVYKELAKIAGENNRPGEANVWWTKVEQLDPNDADLLARKAPPAPPAAAASARPAAPATPPRPAPAAAPAPAPAPAPARSAAPPPPPAPAAAAPRKDQLAKLLTETDVYLKYGLYDKALEHLRRVFAADPESLDAHEKAYQIYVAAKQGPQAAEQLLNVLRLCTRRADAARAQPYLDTLLKQSPHHPELPAFLSVLRPDGVSTPPEELSADEAIVVDGGEEEIVEPELEVASEELESAPMLEDEPLGSVGDEPLGLAPEPEAVEPLELEVESEPSVHDVALEVVADDSDAAVIEEPVDAPEEELVTDVALDTVAIDDDAVVEEPVTFDEPTEQLAVEAEVSFEEPPAEETTAVGAPPAFEDRTRKVVREEPVQAPDAEDPLSEECDEATFFLEQGLTDEAREILETVLIASPGHARATELLARCEQMESERSAPAAAAPAAAPAEERDAFDLAAELADELGELGEEEAPAAPSAGPGAGDYQVSVEEVFSEFKKGLAKVVKPEDVDTHYDLGIAYKEMGLTDDAIGEFTVAREGCAGKKKEIDCLSMIGLLQMQKGDGAAAVGALKEALGNEFATGEVAKGLLYELASAHEAAGSPGKALYCFQRVAQLDAGFRDVAGHVERLAAGTSPEADELPSAKAARGSAKGSAAPAPSSAAVPRAAPNAPAAPPKSRKVGYL